jgi:hypothetical protein
MQLPSTQHLLSAWEAGRAEPHPVQRALGLLAAAFPDVSQAALAELSIGERDARLLALRERAFGPRLDALVVCPRCGERLELHVNASDLRVTQPPDRGRVLSLQADDYEIAFRVPNSADLAALVDQSEIDTGRRKLLERVISHAAHQGREVAVEALPEAVLAALEQQMAAADPQGEVLLDLSCQSCGNEWQALFDVVSFLWSEIDAWAVRLLREVHSLARAYGWREADILAMSPWRRQCYLEMLSG